MDILNTIPKPPQFDGDSYKVAADYLDKIFHLIPPYNGFKLQDIIYSSDLTNVQKNIADYVHDKMEYILKSEGCLETHSYDGNLTLQLNSHGREVQTAGGLSEFKTQKKQVATPNVNIHQGDNYGNIVQSGHQSSISLSQDHRLNKENITNINQTKPSKKSVIEILSWVIGILAGLIAIYEFVIKKFFLNN